MHDALSEEIWAEHEAWRTRREYRELERERWTNGEWSRTRRLADVYWEQRQSGLYVYAATEALWDVHWARAGRRLNGSA